MKVHQLELFYHISLQQGVSAAARALDREQPTLSKQINELERSLHVKLFHRRPFRLTREGEALFAGIEPFFRSLDQLQAQVSGASFLRIGASPIVFADHLPTVEKKVRRLFPQLHLVLREGNESQILQWLAQGAIDLAITLLPETIPAKTFSQPLVQLPPVLLVPKAHRLRCASRLWKQGRVPESLVSLEAEERLSRDFQRTLKSLGVEWHPAIEVASLQLVSQYVSQGYGLGLSVRIPGLRLPPQIRAVNLPGFPAPALGMLWRDNQDRLLRVFREQALAHARKILSAAR